MTSLTLSKIRAVIFDMDGTMVANNKAHKEAWQQFLSQHNISLSDAEFKEKVSGRRNPEIFAAVMGTLTKEQEKAYEEEKEQLYRDLYRPHLQEVPGLLDLLSQIRKKELVMAVATTSPLKNREFVFEGLGIDKTMFATIVGAEEVSKGKPDPEIYLKAASHLGINPEQCLVFEDSPSGVQAAKKAGMQVVAVLTNHSAEELAMADDAVQDFTEFSKRYSALFE